jgi:tyrosinase
MVNGTHTMFDRPSSDAFTVEGIIDLAWVPPENGPTYSMKHHVSSLLVRNYCYIYV